ncbi:MAG: hypothetical protein H0Z24_06280 [Thermosipho sp. (in: Bacteria)]|nr:hypothetical protein [Thermosipho sp. (in: thermotogales)]
MKKVLVVLISAIFITGLFAFPFNRDSFQPQNYQQIIDKLKDIEISEPATYTGTIKEIYIDLEIMKSKIILDTENGEEEIYIGPIWKFIDLKPGMEVELQVVDITVNDDTTFKLAFTLKHQGVTVEIPYRKIIRGRLEQLKRLAYQKRLYQQYQYKKIPMYQYGPMYPYGPMYQNGPMPGYNYPQKPVTPPYPPKGWK